VRIAQSAAAEVKRDEHERDGDEHERRDALASCQSPHGRTPLRRHP
jgi:hypothetical protein